MGLSQCRIEDYEVVHTKVHAASDSMVATGDHEQEGASSLRLLNNEAGNYSLHDRWYTVSFRQRG